MRPLIDFGAEFGLRIVQVAGYDVHYEESTEQTRALYRESILQSAEWARRSCVTLALENVDCPVVDSIEKGLGFIEAADTPWFQMYPDIGNLAAMEKDVPRELLAGGRHIVGVHLKDTKDRRLPPGTVRRGPCRFRTGVSNLEEHGVPRPVHGRDVERDRRRSGGNRRSSAPMAGGEADGHSP